MPDPDEDRESLSRSILDWLTRVGLIATALVAVLSLFLPEENAKKIAYGIAGLLAIISSGVLLYQRHRAKRLRIAEIPEPLAPSAALRGLLPFEEGDHLPGRGRDVQELYTLVTGSEFRFGVLWGESGCGKTSLLRAGLVPKLRNERFLPVYVGRPSGSPQEAIRSALLKVIPDRKEGTEKNLNQLLRAITRGGRKAVIILDQFEEFFLINRTATSRGEFTKWLGNALSQDVGTAFLIGIRADFFAQLQGFAPQIPEPTSTRSTYQLQNFDAEQAKQIFNASARADGIPFEPSLIMAVIRDLEKEEFIRPAELQVVGTRLKRKNILTCNKYEAMGGAHGILSSYISDEIKVSTNQQTARLILRTLCADVVGAKSTLDLSLDEIMTGIGRAGEKGEDRSAATAEGVQSIVNQFVAARVLIRTEEDKYNLAHDYLAPYVQTATAGVETNTERANRFLKRYLAEYSEDPGARIPYPRIRQIERHATPELKTGTKAHELIRKSKLAFYMAAGGIGTLALILLMAIFAFWMSASGLNPVYYGFGRGIVKRENPFTELKGGDMVFGSETPALKMGERLVTKIPIETFWIQQTEVSNRQFLICRLAGGCSFDPGSTEFYGKSGYDEHPVVYITAVQAREFCQWLGGDLPTSEQWERAARGLDGRPWPWGDELTPQRANLYVPGLSGSTVEVDGFPMGASVEGGILNLVGNVSEWTRTEWILADDGNDHISQVWDGTDLSVTLVERGGSIATRMARITSVLPASPDAYNEFLGFRCVLAGD